MLKLSDIEKSFGEKAVLRGVSLTIDRGETVVLSGASGGGKTTLLRIMAGLEKADNGVVMREGRVAVVFAEARLFPSVTVLENVTSVMSGDKKTNAERARALLARFGLAGAEALYPSELSTGMAARVSLARALAYDAEIYLLDEPFKSLDESLKLDVMNDMKRFFHDRAVFIISHDGAEAERMATRRFTLSDGKLCKI